MPNASFQLNGQEVFKETSGVVSVGAGFPAGVIIGAAFLAGVIDGYAGASSTSYTIRSLNNVKYSVNLPVTVDEVSNEFTFDEAGSYLIQASAPALKSDRHILRLSEDSGSSFISSGSAAHSAAGDNVVTRSNLFAKLIILEAEKTSGASERSFSFFTIVDASKTTDGLGNGNNDVTDEEVLQVQLFRISE